MDSNSLNINISNKNTITLKNIVFWPQKDVFYDHFEKYRFLAIKGRFLWTLYKTYFFCHNSLNINISRKNKVFWGHFDKICENIIQFDIILSSLWQNRFLVITRLLSTFQTKQQSLWKNSLFCYNSLNINISSQRTLTKIVFWP